MRLNIPVDAPDERYHVVVHVEPAEPSSAKPEYLSDEFINETAGKWIGDFTIEPEGDNEERAPL